MKLLYCDICRDLVRLPLNGATRPCECGKSYARYVDDENAVVGGAGEIVGIDTRGLRDAVRASQAGVKDISWEGRPYSTAFVGFVAPRDWPTVRRVP